jgi:FMN phosphatase YigB (HAD superfamily)
VCIKVIMNTFRPFLTQGQEVPHKLVTDLLTRYSTHEGYTIFPDVLPLFQMLRSQSTQPTLHPDWTWDKTVVGIITNSDDRVPSVLESFGLKVGPRRVGRPGERMAQASLDDDVNFVVLSYDVGTEKPDRKMFDAAIQMLQETIAEKSDHDGHAIHDGPADVEDFTKLYVGDSLEHDYFGAKQAGWDAVLVDRSERSACEKDTGNKETQLPGLFMEGQLVAGVKEEIMTCSNLAALAAWRPD